MTYEYCAGAGQPPPPDAKRTPRYSGPNKPVDMVRCPACGRPCALTRFGTVRVHKAEEKGGAVPDVDTAETDRA